MKSRILAVLAMLLLAGTSHGWAQETTGAVSGRVTDAQGLAVPGVTVTLTGPQGSKSAVTDADGRYSVPLLVPGTYTAKAELQGFKSVQQQNVIVRLGQSIEVQLKMEVGGVAETIEVTASSPTVDTRSTTVGRGARQRDAEERAGRPSVQRRALPRARRHEQRQRGQRQPVDGRRQRPRQPVRRGRREHHQHRLRRARVLLDHLRLARQRHAVRLRQGSPGEDRRLRGRVRPGDRRRRQRRHQERHEQAAGQRLRLHPPAAAPRATGSSSSRRTAPCRRSARTSATWA